MIRNLKKLCWAVAAALTATSIADAQLGCKKLDSEKPSAYIAFEKEATETINGKSRDTTLLRLTNNTSCEIAVETNGHGIDGVSGSTQERKNNSRQFVFYDTRSSKESSWMPANYFTDRHLFYHYTIYPGFSVIFPVERNHAQKPFRVSVKFTYQWEVTTFENTDHRTFYWFETPKGFDGPSKD